MGSQKDFRTFEADLYLNKQINQVVSIYRSAQASIKKELAKVDLTDFRRSRLEGILSQVNGILNGLNAEARAWAVSVTPFAYRRGFDAAGAQLRSLNVTDRPQFDKQIHTSAVNTLADSITIDLLTANESIRKNIARYIRSTQQALLQDQEISRIISQGVVKGEARKTVSDAIFERFKEQLGNEQFITINGRNFRPDYYSELVARTRTREATSNGIINTTLQYNLDLVQWSVHSGSCPICESLQGKVFSISGTSQDFPALTPDVTPPVHPHCEHVILPVTETALGARGQYNALSRFSLGQSSASSYAEFVGALK